MANPDYTELIDAFEHCKEGNWNGEEIFEEGGEWEDVATDACECAQLPTYVYHIPTLCRWHMPLSPGGWDAEGDFWHSFHNAVVFMVRACLQ